MSHPTTPDVLVEDDALVHDDRFVEVKYSDSIPNNVDLDSDKQLLRALETWHPQYLDWWKDMGPDGFQDAEVYLRTAVGVDPAGWAKFGYVKMPQYRWGILLAPKVEGRTIPCGRHKGEPVWQEVPGEYRSLLKRLIVVQGDTEPASVEQQRHLGLTCPSQYDLRNLFQVNVEEGRHLWAMVYLLHAHFGRDGREEGEALLERRSGDADNPRILTAFNEKTPDWLDKKLSAEGARAARVQMATLTPFMIRGAFIATFLNKYSGLPMAMTGTLSQDSAVSRVKETASFFTTASLPGALERYGAGFRAAGMVRLMHSMVRMNLLARGRWDVATYGIPIPQVDQMPAGTMPAFVTAYRAVNEKRGFTKRERAIVEHCRHQCFLLGLPKELLLETPQDIFESMLVYTATLRDGYDDATNGELVRATMAAYLPESHELPGRIMNALERSISKVFFRHTFRVPTDKVRLMGMVPTPLDYAIFTAFQAYVWPIVFAHMAAERIPVVEGMADRWLVKRIDELLVSYGHAEYTTDPSKYAVEKPAHGAPSPMPHMRPATV